MPEKKERETEMDMEEPRESVKTSQRISNINRRMYGKIKSKGVIRVK